VNVRKALYLLNLLLVALVGYIIAVHLLGARRPQPAAGSPATRSYSTPAAPAPAIQLDEQTFSDLAGGNLFGPAATTANHSTSLAADPALAPAPPRPSLELCGIVAGPPEIARAIILDRQSNKTNLCRAGDLVAGARLLRLEPTAAVLSHNDQEFTLRLDLSHSPAAPGQTRESPDAPAAAAPNPPVIAAAPKVSLQVQVFEDLLRHTVIEPYLVQGEVQGLRISGLQNVPAAPFLNLKDGDVLRVVNGQTLSSKQKAFQVFRKARTQSAIDIELLRDNRVEHLSFPLK